MIEIRDTAETEGAATIPAEWHIDRPGDMPALVLRADPGNHADVTGLSWQFDSLLSTGEVIGRRVVGAGLDDLGLDGRVHRALLVKIGTGAGVNSVPPPSMGCLSPR